MSSPSLAPAAAGASSPPHPWQIPAVRTFALGRTAAVIGMQVLSVSVGWQLYERTASAWALGLVGLFELLPVLALMVPAGQLVDRLRRRTVAMAAYGLWAIAALGLAAVAHAHGPVPLIYALLVVVGTARAFASPASSALLPELLAPEQFLRANAWLASCFEIALITGPALAGWLLKVDGTATLAYLASALGQLFFVAALARLPSRPPAAEEPSERREGVFAGFDFIRRNPVFLAAITLDLFAVLLAGAVALLPMFAKDILHVGPVGLGWLRTAPSLGALLMALAITRLPPWKRPGRALLWAVAGFSVATIGFGLSRSLPLSLCFLFLTGVCDEISVVVRWTLEQVLTPNRLRGRVSAVHYVFIGMSNELGMFESGVTAALVGPVLSVVGGGLGALLIVGFVVWRWPQLAAIPPLAEIKPAA